MSQMPPPPPASPEPAPAPAGGTSAVGSNKKTYTILAYVLTWIGGLIFLFVGKDDPDVKWNSANSLIIFGGLTILNLIFAVIPGINFITVWLIPLIGLGFWIFFAGLLIHPLHVLAWVGVGLFSIAVLFTLLTLPVELNASRRARMLLSASGLVSPTEMQGVSSVLNAA